MSPSENGERGQRDRTKLEQMVGSPRQPSAAPRLMDALGENGIGRCDTCDNCRDTAIRAEAVAQGAA